MSHCFGPCCLRSVKLDRQAGFSAEVDRKFCDSLRVGARPKSRPTLKPAAALPRARRLPGTPIRGSGGTRCCTSLARGPRTLYVFPQSCLESFIDCAMPLLLPRRRFTSYEYERLAETGILGEDERIELLHGEIVEVPPIGSRHAACVNRLNALLSSRLGSHAIVSVQNPLRLGDYDEPEPDVMLLRPARDFYADRHPGPDDLLLVVEVADSSLEFDTAEKLPLYAAAGIAEAWLVDLVHDQVLVCTQASAAGYRVAQPFRRGEVISLTAFSSVTAPVSDILG